MSPRLISVQNQLRAAHARHAELSASVNELDVARYEGWAQPDLRRLKMKKLQAKDQVARLTATLRRLEEARGEVLGSGSFGRILLGRRSDDDGELVAIKLVPIASAGPTGTGAAVSAENVERLRSHAAVEAEVLRTMTTQREPGFPALLHHGEQEVVLEGSARRCTIL